MSNEEERRILVAVVVIVIAYMVMAYQWWCTVLNNYRPPRAPRINRTGLRRQILESFYMQNYRVYHHQIRMNRLAFYSLCRKLRTLGLRSSGYLKVEEQVVIFLITVGHDERNRRTTHSLLSTEIVNRFFHLVLKTVIRLYAEVVTNATTENSPLADNGTYHHWHHYFKDVVGAIDGTHFNVNVALRNQARYHNRKRELIQNTLVAWTFSLKFTYVLTGWEGSPHDGRLLRCAVSRRGHRLEIPPSKYYLADVGFGLVPGFLTPYCNARYHLKEVGRNVAQNSVELYNFRHSSLQNVVERAIGVLKKWFAYRRNSPYHNICVHSKIILACVAMHNFLKDVDPDDEFDPDGLTSDSDHNDDVEEGVEQVQWNDGPGLNMHSSTSWTNWRDQLSVQMWNAYQDFHDDFDDDL